jgi:hypothetical protein
MGDPFRWISFMVGIVLVAIAVLFLNGSITAIGEKDASRAIILVTVSAAVWVFAAFLIYLGLA